MADLLRVTVDEQMVRVPAGVSVAAAVAIAGATTFRRSVSGAPRGPLCGMGICFECRVMVNGQQHVRSCMVACADGMTVRTDG